MHCSKCVSFWGTSYSRPPIDPYLTYPLLQNPGGATDENKGCPYSITERTVPELIPVPGSQPAGDVSPKPGGRLPLLSDRPAVTLATLKRAAANFAAW